MQKDPLEKYETAQVGPARNRIKSLSKLPRGKRAWPKLAVIALVVAAAITVWLLVR